MAPLVPYEILTVLFAEHFDALLFIPETVLIHSPTGDLFTVVQKAANA